MAKIASEWKLSTAEPQLIRLDSWEYNHFRDKDGVIRKISPNQQDQFWKAFITRNLKKGR